MGYRVGIDIGGTFTDGAVVGPGGAIDIFKDRSTPSDPSRGVFNVLRKAAAHYGLPPRDFLGQTELLVLGTTVATNTMLQHRGAATGLITTSGFRDSLELRRGFKPDIWDLAPQRPPVIVPRYRRLGVQQRMDYQGQVLTPLDEDDARRVIRQLRAGGVESIAICLLFSYVNDAHEQRLKEMIAEEFPDVYVAVSSEVLRQVREYERTSTTVVNAYVGPAVKRYLADLRRGLGADGLNNEFLVMQSNGGMMTIAFASQHAVNAVLSGPSAGAIGGLFWARTLDEPNLIVVDMGGTSFDVTLLNAGHYEMTTEGEVGGYRVALPMIDIHTIGAGGGSIASLDDGGLLRVGPQSAGAMPGPACYGQGGLEPTVTDANLLLGYLSADYFLGGQIQLDLEAATQAVKTRIADPLKLDVVEAAHGIYKLTNANMADAIRVMSIQKGHDPRSFAMIAAGGAGPAHAARLAQSVDLPRVIVPKAASVFCALGMLESDLKHDYVYTFWDFLSKIDLQRLNSEFERLEAEGRTALLAEGTAPEAIRIERSMDMRYAGQHHEVTVPVPTHHLTAADVPEIARRFHEAHQRLFMYHEPNAEIETANVRLMAIGEVAKPELSRLRADGADACVARKGVRPVYFEENDGFAETPVYDGAQLRPGMCFVGPAIIEDITTTTVLIPDWKCSVDVFGNLILEKA
ncbi:MAG: hydantoinase/oxoprolinase family protein [Anaerolineales bacterium]|nr:hydantoinase/oxoprolinase family protein [Anaerolineales bacterium]